MEEAMKNSLFKNLSRWLRPITSLVWIASGLAALGLVVALWAKYVGAGSMEIVVSGDTWMKFEVPREGPHPTEVIHEFMSKENVRRDVLAILADSYNVHDLTDVRSAGRVRDMDYDAPFLRAIRRDVMRGVGNFLPRAYYVDVEYSDEVPEGSARVCEESEYFGNRIRLFSTSEKLTLTLSASFLLEHLSCDEGVNEKIAINEKDGMQLRATEGGIDVQALPRGYVLVPGGSEEAS